MMHREPKGGWGRSVRGAESAILALNKKTETQTWGVDLQEWVDEGNLCRKLQTPALYDLPDEKFDAIVKIFQAMGGTRWLS